VTDAKKTALVGKAFRFAPGREGKPAARFWKFWVSGSEVYANSRTAGNLTKISVHASGQIHIRHEGKDLNRLAAPLLLGKGQRLHAFEVRRISQRNRFRPEY